ncbi:ATP-binding protein [Estrella lausannensis]|uniref:DNA polymerase III subunit delta n=1 Tax=Estrella lausannensis TaxID=483423 RepID=A0A0H5DUA9_9BACT|nr:DNA polymerase III subunit delta' [Estrella lausannensis]CRX39514.1 DNA polymerase III subunit delta' [Estrella lausannensis]
MDDLFSHLIGNQRIKSNLTNALHKGAFGQSLCFQGKEGIGKSLFARAFAKGIFSSDIPGFLARHPTVAYTHPDLVELKPAGKIGQHPIESVRRFCEEVYIAPYEAQHKVFIIHDAERMLPTSANALLKTLEEPPAGVIIILLTESLQSLLPTIRSRLQTLYFESVDKEEISVFLQQSHGLSREEADKISLESFGSVGRALNLHRGERDLSEDLIRFLMKGRKSYVELKQFINELDGRHALKRKEAEEALLKALCETYREGDLSAKQRQEMEKQAEGMSAVESLRESKSILLSLLFFFRDLHVIYHGGQESFLAFRENACKLFDLATAKEPIPIEKVEAAVAESIIALERSTPLAACLENLFLKLKLVRF